MSYKRPFIITSKILSLSQEISHVLGALEGAPTKFKEYRRELPTLLSYCVHNVDSRDTVTICTFLSRESL